MHRWRPIFMALVALLAATLVAASAPPPVPESAFMVGAIDEGDPRVEVRLLVDVEAVEVGDGFRVGVLFSMDPRWHIYWRNSGQAGLPTEVVFDSQQARFDELRWPAPTVFHEGGGTITTFGYRDETLLFSHAEVEPGASGAVTIEAAVDYLVCEQSCIPGRASLTRTLPVAATQAAGAAVLERFERYDALVPRAAQELGYGLEVVASQTALRPGDELTVALGLSTCAGPPAEGERCPDWRAPSDLSAAFVPDVIDSIELEVVADVEHPTIFAGRVVGLRARAGADDPGGDQRLAGVLSLENAAGEQLRVWVDEPLVRARPGTAIESVEHPLLSALQGALTEGSSGPSATEPAASSVGLSLWMALLYAFLGGIILNVMPCVFPVLSIKVYSFVETVQKDRRRVLGHGLAYTLGILVSMWVLAAVVIAVQAGGNRLGWGFQFQEPVFVGAIAAVFVVFALWLLGVFEISVGASRLGAATDRATGVRRSFFEGILAVVVATPCSGPFLGLAAGFALAADAPTTVVMFSAIGLGLASPFVLLTLVPALAALLPKPGRWMEIFKQFLAFALFATVVWLVDVMGALAGTDGVVNLLIVLVAVALAVWLFGVAQGSRPVSRAVSYTLGAAALAGAIAWVVAPDISRIQWRVWSEDAVAAELESGRPVFVDFTAEWCVTCKATEEFVIDTDEVIQALADYNVSTFKADWTRPDEDIRAKLAEFGRGGVPMYLVYSPAAPNQPRLLPEVITVNMLVEALEEAAGGEEVRRSDGPAVRR